MKTLLVLLLSFVTAATNAQSLKDALYGGKLKTDSGTVIKKGDDLRSKIDTSTKKKTDTLNSITSNKKTDTVQSIKREVAEAITTVTTETTVEKPENRDNNTIWKEYIDSMTTSLNEEVMSSKKLKKGDYAISVDYTIGLDGKITINYIFPIPDNKFLADELKSRLSASAPLLNPVLGSNGKPRKIQRKYNFSLSK